ncbi:hypothetical protein PYK79_10795 [Streptomyces sp. ID05-04B]|uniref:hypothetical protein n=1 Tax=Streptomyces sp. ID05-04B TaxID=3028661 RepID=UPI0029C55471|nr:hypothetical protein [Streptomyces sp. ID05-04B]MDX5563740.1 hypothetical protein [Streptomyces sp. ID05-04B]
MPQPGETQTCPRRMHDFGPWGRSEGLDLWTAGRGVAGQEEVGMSCSFCGSLNPDRFMELVREGWIVGPTDKNYKAYLHRPLSDEEKAERKATWLRNFTTEEAQVTAEEHGEGTAKTRADLESYYDAQVAPTAAGSTEAKFYYQHLSAGQQAEFIGLYNERRMKVGYPGRLYVLPFFAASSSA